MSTQRDSGDQTNNSNKIEDLKGKILARWRDEVRRDPEQAALIHNVGDQEFEDHLPELTEKLIKLFRGEATESLEGRRRPAWPRSAGTWIFRGAALAGVPDSPPGSDRHASRDYRSER